MQKNEITFKTRRDSLWRTFFPCLPDITMITIRKLNEAKMISSFLFLGIYPCRLEREQDSFASSLLLSSFSLTAKAKAHDQVLLSFFSFISKSWEVFFTLDLFVFHPIFLFYYCIFPPLYTKKKKKKRRALVKGDSTFFGYPFSFHSVQCQCQWVWDQCSI